MEQSTLKEFEDKCIQEEAPSCQTFCPLHLDVRSFVNQMGKGQLKEARKTLERYMPLALINGYLCEGPCQKRCQRSQLDLGINLPLLEKYCLDNTSTAKPIAFPSSGRKAALVGSGLTSLTCAWELSKKGHQVIIFHCGEIGEELLKVARDKLPASAMETALDLLVSLKVTFKKIEEYPALDFINNIKDDYGAIFLGFDDPALEELANSISPGDQPKDEIVLATGLEKIFAGPLDFKKGQFLFSTLMARGKSVSISIDRQLQGVSPYSARINEGVYESKLFTNLCGQPIIPPEALENPLAPSLAEIQKEAKRCLFCQCLECVKKCAFLRAYKSYPKKYLREFYNTIATAFGIRHSNIQINSCAQCGLCKEICPQGLDLGLFCSLARKEMVAGNHMPVSAHEFALEDLLYSQSPEISFFRHQPGFNESKYIFFPGCQLPSALPNSTLNLYSYLTKHLEGGLGFFLSCCGAPARWSGRPGLTQTITAGLNEIWLKSGKPQIILACPSCRLFFQNELPEIPITSLWNVLVKLPLPEKYLKTKTLALHDPCSARGDSQTLNDIRELLKRIGQSIEETPMGKKFTRCCGYGGLLSEANQALANIFVQERADDSQKDMITYCVMRRDRLVNVLKSTLHVLDLLFPDTSPEISLNWPSPDI